MRPGLGMIAAPDGALLPTAGHSRAREQVSIFQDVSRSIDGKRSQTDPRSAAAVCLIDNCAFASSARGGRLSSGLVAPSALQGVGLWCYRPLGTVSPLMD